MTLTAWDLFCGTCSATKYFKRSDDWEVVGVDVESTERINPDVQKDILDVGRGELPDPDFVWASPPCTTFSMASVRWYWEQVEDGYAVTTEDKEKAEKARRHLKMVEHTFDLIDAGNPRYWFVENPRALLRTLTEQHFGRTPTGTVTYCQYGEDRMKPTDLWGVHPDGFEYRKCSNGDDCHDSAPRGTTHQGTQSSNLDAVERAMVPDQLAKEVFEAVDGDVE